MAFSFPNPASPTHQRITILGAGIVGSALAFNLSTDLTSSQIILLDASPSSTNGSTALAPGLVGQLNTIPHLTAMAKETVAAYSKIPGGFQKVGGLEIARTKKGVEELQRREELAKGFGLEAEILGSGDVASLAPDFQKEDGEMVGLLFMGDGTADPRVIVRHYQEQAKERGVMIVAAKTSAISVEGGKISMITNKGALETDKLIVAAGIWTPALLKDLEVDLPIIPVAHPYAHGPRRPQREKQQPFVRWPERHVYARDHGDCDGFGSYDHVPVPCLPSESALFERGPDAKILETALSVFQSPQLETKIPYKVLNGIFALSPDSMPLAGAIPQISGLYVAAAVWIAHAAGVARLVADIVAEKKLNEEDKVRSEVFHPMRFEAQEAEILKERALRTYNDIYNQQKH